MLRSDTPGLRKLTQVQLWTNGWADTKQEAFLSRTWMCRGRKAQESTIRLVWGDGDSPSTTQHCGKHPSKLQSRALRQGECCECLKLHVLIDCGLHWTEYIKVYFSNQRWVASLWPSPWRLKRGCLEEDWVCGIPGLSCSCVECVDFCWPWSFTMTFTL